MKYTFRFLCVAFVFFVSSQFSQAQLLSDPGSIKLVQSSLDHIYNYEFDEAELVINQVEKKYPNHPVTHILNGFILYWKYLPIKDNPAKSKEYIQRLNLCLESISKKFGKNSNDPEAIFYTMVARGYMAMLYNYRGEMLNAAGEGKKAYNAFTEGMNMMNKNPEFYFTSGMYNYYVELYPEIHPIVKPVMFFFKDGDKTLGLKQIDTGVKLGTITKAEACYYITHIYLKYEMKPEKAVPYISKLAGLYPKNPIYQMKNIEALLLSGNYEAASKNNAGFKRNNTGFFPIAWHTFQGMLLEKGEKNDVTAEREYLQALKTPHDDQYTKEYYAMSYAGLARIANRAGNKAKAKDYYKKCLEKSEYKSVMKEAKSFK